LSPSIHDRRAVRRIARLGPLLWMGWLAGLVGCGGMDGWRESWQAARAPDRHLRLGGAQIPLELVEGWAMRCPSTSFVITRVGKVRFSHDGFRALVKGQSNVACTSAKIPWYEARDYRDAHGHLPCGWRIAWDAYAVYVHPDNPVRQITIQQFKQVLRNQITSWSTLDGPSESINLYGPPRNGRAGRVFMQIARLFMADPPWRQIADPDKIVEAVSNDPMAMGLTRVGHAETAPYLALKGVIDRRARVPDYDTLEADTWPLLKTIWIWTADPPDPAAADLIDYLYSDKGQAVIKASGYTPIPRDRGTARITLRDLPASPSTRPR